MNAAIARAALTLLAIAGCSKPTSNVVPVASCERDERSGVCVALGVCVAPSASASCRCVRGPVHTPARLQDVSRHARRREGARLRVRASPASTPPRLTKQLRPTSADYKAVFDAKAAAASTPSTPPEWDRGSFVVSARPGQTEVKISSATVADLKANNEKAKEFPERLREGGVAPRGQLDALPLSLRRARPGAGERIRRARARQRALGADSQALARPRRSSLTAGSSSRCASAPRKSWCIIDGRGLSRSLPDFGHEERGLRRCAPLRRRPCAGRAERQVEARGSGARRERARDVERACRRRDGHRREAVPSSRARKRAQGSGSGTLNGPGGRPTTNGPKLPDALRKQLEKQLEARIERDVTQIKALRGEAIGLLSTFVAETPREAREMPEALLRLGELKWELEREQFVERFRAWEAKPVDQRGPEPRPELPALARSLRARPQGLSVVQPVRPGALRRRLPRLRAGQAGRGDRSLQSHPQGLPALAVRRRRPHGARRVLVQWQIRLPSCARRIRRSPQVQEQRALRARALQERLVHVAPRSQRGGGQALRQRLRGHRCTGQGQRRAAQAARRAPGRGAEVPRRGLHRGREEHRAGRLRLPHQDRRRPLRRQGGARARRAVLRSGPLRPRNRGLRAAPQARARELRRRHLGPPDCAGLQRHRGVAEATRLLRSRRHRLHRRLRLGEDAGRPRRRRAHELGDREAAQGARPPAPRQGAEGQDEPRRVRGRRGPLLRSISRSSRARRARTRFIIIWARSTSTTSTRGTTPRPSTWRPRAACPRTRPSASR